MSTGLTNQIKLQTLINNVNGRYVVEIHVLEISHLVEQLSLEFGEPIINVGGDFLAQAKRPDETGYTDIEFTLPNRDRRLDTDFPVTEVFDLADNDCADLYAKVWAEEISDRIILAKTELLTNHSDFVGETIKTV